MQRANPVNPFYVDTRVRFTASTQEHGQTFDPNKQVLTQNPSRTTQFTAPEFTIEPATSGVESTNPVVEQVLIMEEVEKEE